MRKIVLNIFKLVVVLTCVLMQVSMTMPHHHHSAEASACINPFHCLEQGTVVADHLHDHGCAPAGCSGEEFPGPEGCCCGDHCHDTDKDRCGYSQLDFFVQGDRSDNDSKYYLEPVTLEIIAACLCGFHKEGVFIQETDYPSELPRDISLPSHELTALASPPRAPSFTV